jgi:hypothetical protein
MQREEIDDELKNVSFDYFYWYSRFEFALKEHHFLKNEQAGANAEVNWKKFQESYGDGYSVSSEANRLIKLHPKRQIISEQGGLDWRPVGIAHCKDDLCKVIVMLAAVRNNLFHGGKHGDADVDSRERNLELLKLGKLVLDQLAQMANFEGDYKRYY